MIPGWPYSIVAALKPGRTSWTALLDAQRLEPGADVAAVTAATSNAVATVWQASTSSRMWSFDMRAQLATNCSYEEP